MSDDELIESAVLVGLDSVDDDERAEIEAQLRTKSPEARAAYAAALRDTREAMARVAETSAVAPPATLRAAILTAATEETGTDESGADESGAGRLSVVPDAGDRETDATTVHRPSAAPYRRFAYLAAAAVLAVVTGAVGWLIGARSDSPAPESDRTAAQVFAARDVASRSGPIATGRASLTFSDSADAAVLVMNDVPPPKPGTVYQMWLAGPDKSMQPAGTMTDADVEPSTTAVITGVRGATALVFTVEPAGGSPQPTSVVAELPLR